MKSFKSKAGRSTPSSTEGQPALWKRGEAALLQDSPASILPLPPSDCVSLSLSCKISVRSQALEICSPPTQSSNISKHAEFHQSFYQSPVLARGKAKGRCFVFQEAWSLTWKGVAGGCCWCLITNGQGLPRRGLVPNLRDDSSFSLSF